LCIENNMRIKVILYEKFQRCTVYAMQYMCQRFGIQFNVLTFCIVADLCKISKYLYFFKVYAFSILSAYIFQPLILSETRVEIPCLEQFFPPTNIESTVLRIAYKC
jgi:hypothetical protein